MFANFEWVSSNGKAVVGKAMEDMLLKCRYQMASHFWETVIVPQQI